MGVLLDELSRTGIHGQGYQRAQGVSSTDGLAFLVYYSPTFMRNLSPLYSLEAVLILAELYRCARELWPLESLGQVQASHTVTIRIDQLKERPFDNIMEVYTAGSMWVLARRNDLEAVIEVRTMQEIL